jgi:predicted transcriptional regulator
LTPESPAFRHGEYVKPQNKLFYNKIERIKIMKKRLNLAQYHVESDITASTTQTQGKCILTHHVNEISVCATTNDVVTLPDAIAGLQVTVINAGAQTLQVFPFSGDHIDNGAVNASTTLATTKSAIFISYKHGYWVKFAN